MKFLVAPLLAALSLSLNAQTTVTFRQGLNGYTGVTDTMLQQAAPTTNAGTGPTVDVVGGTTAQKQGLLKFANVIGTGTGQVPPNAQITNAKLELSVWTAGSGVAVHRMNKAWTESATWNSMVNGLQIGDEEAHWSAVDTKTNLPRGLGKAQVGRIAHVGRQAASIGNQRRRLCG
jgi:hypothetical protein